MNIREHHKNIKIFSIPFIVIAISTLIAIAIGIYCLISGWFIIFQNLFYIPIIIACIYYTKKGFIFSVSLSLVYLFLIISFTRDSIVIMQALIRILIFVCVAGVTTHLSIRRHRAEEMLFKSKEDKRVEKVLQESEARYKKLFIGIEAGILVADLKTKQFFYANPAICRMYGYTEEDFKLLSVQDIHPKDKLEYVLSEFAAQGRNEKIVASDIPCLRKDNTIFYANINSVKMILDNRECLVGLFTDVTERKHAEIEISRINRALRMLSDTNQALIHISDESKLLSEICRIAVEVGGYQMTWVGFAEHNNTKTLLPVAHAGFDSGYIESANITWADNERGQGPGGIAIRTGKPCIARNIPLDPSFAPWREAALKRGYESIIALPLISEDQTYGAIGIYSSETDAFDVREVEILKELADDLAYGINVLRIRAKHDIAEAALVENEKKFKSIIQSQSEGIGIVDKNEIFEFTNTAAEKIFETEPGGLIGTCLYNFLSPVEIDKINYQTSIRKKGVIAPYELQITTKKGNIKYIHVSATAKVDENNNYQGAYGVFSDITERKHLEEDRLAHLKFFESMDKVNRIILGSNNLEQVMSNVLDTTLSIFDCDRAWLLYPCDPDAPSYCVPMEITKPEYPGAKIFNVDVPMTADAAQNMRESLESYSPVTYTAGTEKPINKATAEQFGVQSQMFIPVYPKLGKPWIFGMHQCSYPRLWTSEDMRLFHEISRRLSDALSSLLIYRDLCKSEAENRAIVNAVPDLLFRINKDFIITDFRKPGNMELYTMPEQFLGKTFIDVLPSNVSKIAMVAIEKAIKTNEIAMFEYELKMNSQNRHYEGRVISISNDDVLAVVRDITDRKNAEENLNKEVERGNLLLELYEKAPHLSNKELYDYTLEQAVRLTNSSIGFFHLVSDDQKNVILTTWNSLALRNCTAEFETHYPIEKAGNWVDCVRYKRSMIYNDFTSSPNQKGLPEGHSPVNRFMSIPVIEDDKVRIIFGVGNKLEKYNDNDVINIQLVANELHKIIKQRIAEKALRESEERYRLIAENTADTIAIFDLNLKPVYISPAIFKMRGYSVEEALNQSLNQILTPDSLQKAQSVFAQQMVLESNEKANPSRAVLLELEAYCKNGSTIIVEIAASSIRDANLNPNGILMVIRDITQRKQVEKALFESEEKLLTIFNTMEEAITFNEFVFNDKGEIIDYRILEVNPAFEKQTSLSYDQIVGKLATEIYKMNTEYIYSFWKTHIDDRQAIKSEMFIEQTKEWKHITTSIPANNKFVISFFDITKRKLAEEALKEKHSTLRGIIDSTDALIFSLDRKYNYTSFNHKHASVMMEIYNADIKIGCNILKYMTNNEDLKKAKYNIDRALAGEQFIEESYSGEEFLSRLYFQVSHSPIRSEDGEIIGVAVLSKDMTERKRSEEALSRSQAELKAIYDFSPVIMCVINESRDILYANKAFMIFTGVNEKNLKGSKAGNALACINALDNPRGCGFGINCQNCVLRLAIEDTFKTGNGHQNFDFQITSVHNNTKQEFAILGSTTLIQADKQIQLLVCLQDTTKRKQVEKALIESEERYRLIAEHTADTISVFDFNLKPIYISPTKYNLRGYSVQETITQSMDQILTPESLQKVKDTFTMQMEIEASRNADPYRTVLIELEEYCKDGSTICVELAVSFLRDVDLNPTGILTVTRDISERKRAEQKLRESEERFRLILENMPILLNAFDKKGKVIVWNNACEEVTGYKADEIINNPNAMELLYPDPEYRAKVWNSSLDPQYSDNIYDLVTKKGEVKTIEWFDIYHYLKIPGWATWGLGLDITEQKQAEKALVENEIKYRTVADFTYDWEYWLSANDMVLYMSPSVERITGYTVEEFRSNPQLIDQVVFKDDVELWKNHKLETHNPNNNKKHLDIEFRIISKTGDIHWIGHICRKIQVEGKYLGMRVSNRDITEKVKAESELFNVTINVEERERNHFSRELHDGLGPLLSTVKLYFQWLAETDNPEKIKIITEKGNNNIEQAIKATREISQGLSSLLLKNSGYVDAVQNFTQIINETKKITINFTFNYNQRFDYSLEITIYRITTELINNTLKYAQAKQIIIEFNIIEKKLITLIYKDDGIGFDLTKIEKNSKGLGLISIKQRIKILRGDIKINTSQGKGINVYIEIPVNDNS